MYISALKLSFSFWPWYKFFNIETQIIIFNFFYKTVLFILQLQCILQIDNVLFWSDLHMDY